MRAGVRMLAALALPLMMRDVTPVGERHAVHQPAATVLMSETFDDGDFAARGWYDLVGDLSTSTTERRPGGGTRSLEWRWTQGGTNPVGSTAGRHKFPPTDRVFVRYWVKYSENWMGSGQTTHPHEFMLLTTEDEDYVGPAFTHLTAYIEHNWRRAGGVPILGLQDGRSVDLTKVNQNLVGLSENRAVNGCNGIADAYSNAVGCYAVGGSRYFNGRTFGEIAGPLWSNNVAAANYKSNWHKVEAYFQLNSVANGIGRADGLIRYWFDDQLILELPDILMRTGQYPGMRFNQFMLGPWIGSGSPVSQAAWIDDVIVATGRVN